MIIWSKSFSVVYWETHCVVTLQNLDQASFPGLDAVFLSFASLCPHSRRFAVLNAASWGKRKHSRSKAQACRVFYRISEIAISCTCELASQQSIPASLSTVFLVFLSNIKCCHHLIMTIRRRLRTEMPKYDCQILECDPKLFPFSILTVYNQKFKKTGVTKCERNLPLIRGFS